jgi:hypothetical protein
LPTAHAGYPNGPNALNEVASTILVTPRLALPPQLIEIKFIAKVFITVPVMVPLARDIERNN